VGYYYNLRWNPPGVLKCPARNYSTDWYQSGYGYYAGGANDKQMKLSDLYAWAQLPKFAGNRGGNPDGLVAIWGDRVDPETFTGNAGIGSISSIGGGIAQTGGHWDYAHGWPEGGNVGRIDGSVLWYPYVNRYEPGYQAPSSVFYFASNVYVQGDVISTAHPFIAFPQDSMIFFNDYNGNILPSSGNPYGMVAEGASKISILNLP
jgi:hypothetical protein